MFKFVSIKKDVQPIEKLDFARYRGMSLMLNHFFYRYLLSALLDDRLAAYVLFFFFISFSPKLFEPEMKKIGKVLWIFITYPRKT